MVAINLKAEALVYCDSIDLKKRILQTHPSSEGLFPHEVEMLFYTNLGSYTTSKRKYSGIWYYQFSVVAPEGLFFSLVDRGYIRLCNDGELYQYLKMNEIRSILKTKNLKSGSTKESAKAVLRENFTDDEICSLYSDRYYILTEKGKRAIDSQPAKMLDSPVEAWKLFVQDSSKPLLKEYEITLIDTTEYSLYIDSNYCGKLTYSRSNITVNMFPRHHFDSPVTLRVIRNNELFVQIENVCFLSILHNTRRLIIGEVLDAETTTCTCYDLDHQEKLFTEKVLSNQLLNPTIPKDQYKIQNLALDNTGIVCEDKIYYYISASNGISEVIISDYLSRFATVQRVRSLARNDFSSNYCVALPSEDLEHQQLIMYMIICKYAASPSILGAPIYRVLRSMLSGSNNKIIQAFIDNESSSTPFVSKAAHALQSEISNDFDVCLTRLLSIYPPRAIAYDPFPYYTCKSNYGKDPNFYHVVKTREQWDKKYGNLLLQLKEEGVLNPRWVSEFSLYMLVKARYVDTEYQWRADWLGLQSIDVYIPNLKIGIEYQGEQHYRPVELFGGEKGYKGTKARDVRKKQLCQENGVTLIEWPYNLEISDTNLHSMINERIHTELSKK